MKLRPSPSAFSLVELTLSLGLVSFVLIALLGLFGVALKSDRSSTDGTLLPQIVQQARAAFEKGTLPSPGTASEYYFDSMGIPVDTAADAVYQIKVNTRVPDETSELPSVGARLRVITMDITYPGGGRTIVSSLPL